MMKLMFVTTLKKNRKPLAIYTKKYENILLMGDYNLVVKETNMKVVLQPTLV